MAIDVSSPPGTVRIRDGRARRGTRCRGSVNTRCNVNALLIKNWDHPGIDQVRRYQWVFRTLSLAKAGLI
jgi:hypothetical protein